MTVGNISGMDNIIKKNKIWIIIAVILTVIHVLYASFSQRAAYMDGALVTVQLLDLCDVNYYTVLTDAIHPRFFMYFINQFPVVLSYFVFGIKSKYWLSFICSLSVFCIPLLILLWNFFVSKRTKRYDIFVISIFVYSVLILPFSIYSIVELIPASMFWLVLLNYLAADMDYTKKDLIFITCLVILLFGSYESVVLIGVTLFVGSLYYASKEQKIFNKIVKYFIGLGGLLSSVFVTSCFIISSQLRLEAIDRMQELVKVFYWSNYFLNLNLILSIFAFSLIPFILFKKDYLSKKNLLIILSGYCLLLISMFANLKIFLAPLFERDIRLISCYIIPLLFMYIIIADSLKKKESSIFYTNLFTIILICAITHTIWQINNTFWFNRNVQFMLEEMQKSPTPLRIINKDEVYNTHHKFFRRYFYDSNYTGSSILFAPEKEIKTLLIPSPSFNTKYIPYIDSKNLFTIPPSFKYELKTQFWDITKQKEALPELKKASS